MDKRIQVNRIVKYDIEKLKYENGQDIQRKYRTDFETKNRYR